MLGRDNIPLNRSKDGRFVNVDANTLDNIIHSEGIKAEDVKWIKIDVEGAEYEVLKGAKSILSKSSNISLLIEIHNLSIDNTTLYEPIKELLNSYNFKIESEKVASNWRTSYCCPQTNNSYNLNILSNILLHHAYSSL